MPVRRSSRPRAGSRAGARRRRRARALPPARPWAISSALESPWVGTKPSARAAWWSRQPATTTAPSRSSAGRQLSQSAYGRSGWQARPCAVGDEGALVARGRLARRPRAPRSVRPSRSSWKSERYGSCVPWAKWRESRWRRIAVPPSTTGKASRQRRSASPSATAAAVIGFSRSRGEWWCCQGMPITIASSGCSSRTARRAIPRSSASAWATDGGPANAADRGQLAGEIVEEPAAEPRRQQSRTGAAASARGGRAPACS